MLVKISVLFAIVNLLYELIEIIFPMSKMADFVKSFVSIVFLYVICLKLMELI